MLDGRLITCPCSNSVHIGRYWYEHLMYAWWVITCPCSNSTHIGRISDVCLVGLLLAPVFIVHILIEHLIYAW